MTKTARLLLYLDTDPAHIGDIAYCLYGEDTPENQLKAQSIIKNTRALGWDIFSAHGIRYTITLEHYKLITQAGIEVISKIRTENYKLTPYIIKREIERRKLSFSPIG